MHTDMVGVAERTRRLEEGVGRSGVVAERTLDRIDREQARTRSLLPAAAAYSSPSLPEPIVGCLKRRGGCPPLTGDEVMPALDLGTVRGAASPL